MIKGREGNIVVCIRNVRGNTRRTLNTNIWLMEVLNFPLVVWRTTNVVVPDVVRVGYMFFYGQIWNYPVCYLVDVIPWKAVDYYLFL